MRGGEAVPVAVLTGDDPAQPREVVDANVPPARLPSHHFAFTESPNGLECFAFAPCGDVGYAQTTVEVVEVWPLLAARWPEIGSGVLMLLSLAAWLAARRRLRFATAVGKPLCGRCGYQVDLTQRNCPECGVDLETRRPRIGRSRARRLAPIVAPMLTLWFAFVTMLVIGVPRYGYASRWRSWPSELVCRLVQHYKLNVRTATGCATYRMTWRESASTRRLGADISLAASWLACSPDGRFLLGGAGSIFDADTGRGRYVRSGVLPWQAVPIGFARVPSAAVFQDGRDIYLLDLVSRTSTRVAQLTSNVNAMCLALQPSQLISFVGGEATRTALPGVEGLVPAPPREKYTYDDRFSTDGSFVASWNLGAFTIRRCAGAGQSEVTTLQAGPDDSFTASFDLSQTGGLLAVGTRRPAILVRDLERNAWVAALALPPGYYGARPLFSPDARWIAARAQTGDGRTKPFRHELFIWDLAEILGTSEHGQPVSEPTPP